MTPFIIGVLILTIIVVFLWMCKSSMEPFADMRPWFGYEPGRYGPGWGRKGCETVSPNCVMV
jgi:hypothetical protein